jgi:hypothetical protein
MMYVYEDGRLLMVRVGMRVGAHARRRLHGRGSAGFGAN